MNEREPRPAVPPGRVTVEPNGPYRVEGGVPLVHKEQVVSEHGEPLTWRKVADLATGDSYRLCRCGRSADLPFCDDSHLATGFDGTETADTGRFADRHVAFRGVGIVVKRDHALCMEAGFCGNRLTNVEQLVEASGDSAVRAQIMAMIERCPSGSYSYALSEEAPDLEPDLPAQIAVTVEMTSEGPVGGPLWVSGGIPVARADGQPLETRPRMMLCGCGLSRTKPLCDGSHRQAGVRPAARLRRPEA